MNFLKIHLEGIFNAQQNQAEDRAHSKKEFRTCRGVVDLFQLLMENNLEEVFPEIVTHHTSDQSKT